ncbi:MAG: hypothetical protein UR25_C0004G0082 [Candidatus Nomurabacteria bacterium GW2011_GWE1_32_28]|uniref:Uncharacterized protein n=1 Tax=Candidatus Nomurabacteria bacterium GW2011_GWF1_31_48 TaxID=1618767 RepID=A0A0G0BGM2_9BACT|nr:MAG: hypothetical protein UR10_C0004G0082 [Candidatus Nomurabacteria bacterium GW2011_GWF2_30_133]KKP28616.1 MAG: hypothetical protein UR18_C0002G0028 [Candidatus Nomurabacteria bacterium GW2011_GWE2_31_40]KKP30192.1 MAG: hypothetical protein UR19_C0003G0028 [Candidatus Nomurabacteria bacterium GW2011_GWF1_31_48]KKP34718.1 MAG: hypothetical protein UR25_C0004G0082 [Candidatus Nomurabacteria bacterium GW2011_GWE1_32_28]HAS80823.1 hypothetical protein [Candidatus Nomurabacteria bacterium]
MKNNKGFVGVSLILSMIAVLAVGSGIYYWWMKNSLISQNLEIKNSKLVENSDKVDTEESLIEFFHNQPGDIKSITKDNNKWILEVDLLTRNLNWLPGIDSTGEFFINQNLKIRDLYVTENTKTYDCNQEVEANFLMDTLIFISNLQKATYKTVYFDIDGENITAMYQQCLP